MNPFSKDRYEHIPTQLYYLPEKLITELEDAKPSCVIGSRGSGKTTLLKSLSWEERLRNKWLNQELGGDAFRGNFIGVYTKLPLVQVKSFRAWQDSFDTAAIEQAFGYYIDLVSIENLAFSLYELIGELHLDVTPKAESEAVDRFIAECDYLIESDKATPTNLVQLHRIIRQRRRQLEMLATASVDPTSCFAGVFLPVIGELSRAFCKSFGEMLDRSKMCTNELSKWHFKFCFDEAEVLSNRQLLVINTLIRTTEAPASYVISFVGQPSDLSRTLHEDLSSQSADRFIHFLDHITKPDFEKLCEGVASVRIRAHLESEGGDKQVAFTEFKLADLLGRLDLNVLVHDFISKSESREAKVFTEQAELFRDSDWLTDHDRTSVPPYVEAYLAARLDLVPPPGNESNAKRRQASQEFRKKFVASFLSICRDFRVRKIPYAFSNMVIGVSDSCVRDFLAQMHQIFESCGKSLTEFIAQNVDWRIQNDAIRIASDNKKRSISEGKEVSKPEDVRRLTYCLGAVTAILQQGSKDSVVHLKSSERGLFQFPEPIRDTDAMVFRALKDASGAGFLRVKSEGQRIIGFRVHASMAPSFGFSYRGAYYPVIIRKEEVIEMLETSESDELNSLARRIAKRISDPKNDSSQMTLWPTNDTSGFVFDDSNEL